MSEQERLHCFEKDQASGLRLEPHFALLEVELFPDWSDLSFLFRLTAGDRCFAGAKLSTVDTLALGIIKAIASEPVIASFRTTSRTTLCSPGSGTLSRLVRSIFPVPTLRSSTSSPCPSILKTHFSLH
jgi:hypothetical protein